MSYYWLLFILATTVFSQSFKFDAQKNIKIQDLKREVDLTSRWLQTKIDVKKINNNYQYFQQFTLHNDNVVSVDKFYHVISKDNYKKLFFIELSDGTNQIQPKHIIHADLEQKHNLTLLEFTLVKPISSGMSKKYVLRENYYDRYQMLPKQILLTEDQLTLSHDYINFVSVYECESQQSHFKVRGLKSYEPKNAVERGTVLEYDRLTDVPALKQIPLKIHSENNQPLPVFSKVRKTIEVSHWGNIAIVEEYSLINRGANLTGEFGRVVYNKFSTTAGRNALKQLEAHLPFKSWGIYLRDEIGNISTTRAQRGQFKGQKEVLVEITPRFPLLGGWKSNFELGYNLPTTNNLKVSSTDPTIHVLNEEFGFAIGDMVAEEYELQVILPEGTRDISYQLPRQVDDVIEKVTFSYLDLTGRPTIIFKKKLVSFKDELDFKVQKKKKLINSKLQYKFDEFNIYRECFMIFGAFIVFFMFMIILGRLQLDTFKLKSN